MKALVLVVMLLAGCEVLDHNKVIHCECSGPAGTAECTLNRTDKDKKITPP